MYVLLMCVILSFLQCEDDYCILIAVACGRDELDINHQTRALNEGFITYLLSKQAAGIVNVPLPGSEQVCILMENDCTMSLKELSLLSKWY